MSYSANRNWLIAYDITEPRRLGRVHRYLKNHAIPVQYSVFVFRGNHGDLQDVLGGIAERIEPGFDDVRAYHVPDRCEVAMLGRQELPEGIVLPGPGLERLLRVLTADDVRPIVDPGIEADISMNGGYVDENSRSWQPLS